MPLTQNKTKNSLYMKNLTPEIEFEGETYLFMTQQLSSIPEDVLKDCIGSLEQSRELLIGAIDFAITGI
ncbi:MAG: CcdB family protein [Alteromonas macleodii]|uniref:CcdB family protein n=1 Tax=Alteromonas TaxID=226 RepID=UPI0025A371E3|nr:CcdB family protein [Alteromonas macleodii]MDM7960990.1 CcdB family protein [Alteromonas macleodii]MDM8169816.1 CcdB family protein [Alteromonas macleodii]